ncbi:hypothetical protein [Bordetella genomosp. 1]|nr:hypothetical protein [Bordetella genomosp. 1]
MNMRAMAQSGDVAALKRPGEVLLVGPWHAFARVSPTLLITDASAFRAALYPFVRDDTNRNQLLTMYRRIMCTGSTNWQQSPEQVVDHVAGMAQVGAVAAMLVPDAVSDGGNQVPDVPAAMLEAPPGPVSQWPLQARFAYVLRRALDFMAPALREEFAKLVSPEAIAAVVAALVVWAGSHAVGVGQVMDVILIAVGFALAGWAIFDAVGHLIDFITGTVGAKTHADLDKAAQALAAGAAALGAGVVIALLTRGAGRLARQAGGKRRAAQAEELGEGSGQRGGGLPPNRAALDPNEVRLSQNTVSNNRVDRLTGERYTYDDLVDSMRTKGWQGEPVDVVRMPDGKLTSMDNTRITAAREAGIDVQATMRDYNEPLTRVMQTERNWQQYDTWGEAISGRIGNQSGGFGKANPYGSYETPRITGRK